MDKIIIACDSFNSNRAIPQMWQTYFSDTCFNTLTYWMLGINAHINGDMVELLALDFSLDELKKKREGSFRI